MNTQPQPFRPVDPIDELLERSARIVEAPLEIDCEWEEVTREYDTRAFTAGQPPSSPADPRTTVELLKDARIGLDLFLNESSVALLTGRSDLTEHQRMHLEKIVTFIQALGDRFDRVMRGPR